MKYLIVLVIIVAYPILSAKGFMSSNIGIQDIKHKCDKGTLSCYALGLKTGQIAGTQMKQSGFLVLDCRRMQFTTFAELLLWVS